MKKAIPLDRPEFADKYLARIVSLAMFRTKHPELKFSEVKFKGHQNLHDDGWAIAGWLNMPDLKQFKQIIWDDAGKLISQPTAPVCDLIEMDASGAESLTLEDHIAKSVKPVKKRVVKQRKVKKKVAQKMACRECGKQVVAVGRTWCDCVQGSTAQFEMMPTHLNGTLRGIEYAVKALCCAGGKR